MQRYLAIGQLPWVGQPKAIALLSVEYADGTTADIVTDGSWTTAGGPILYDDTRHGELYDAREEKAGWNRPGFVADGWKARGRGRRQRAAVMPR